MYQRQAQNEVTNEEAVNAEVMSAGNTKDDVDDSGKADEQEDVYSLKYITVDGRTAWYLSLIHILSENRQNLSINSIKRHNITCGTDFRWKHTWKLMTVIDGGNHEI